MDNLNSYLGEFDKAVEHLKSELSGLRTGRANPGILDGVIVEAYGAETPINQVASVSVPEARCIVITPWDKSVIKNIEKGILAANLGLNPVNEGTQIRLVVPQMTEESRKEMVKILGQKLEHAKQVIRKIREEIKEEINQSEKDKEISEDKKFELLKKLEEITQTYNDKIKESGEAKEKEIMTI